MVLECAYRDRMQRLREALNIAGQQSHTWLRFETAVKAAEHVSPGTECGNGLVKYPSLPTALSNELQKALFRAEACRELFMSADALYAVLSETQRRHADRLLFPAVNEVLKAASVEMQPRNMAA